jgi:tRNA(fMet)-specific endonuclease VapC
VTVRCLLDTDVAVEATRKRDREVHARLRAETRVALSAVSLYELRFGAEKSADPRANHDGVDELLAIVDLLEFDAAGAAHAGEIRAELRRAGTPIGPYDTLIAGHARSRGLVLVTRNVGEFERVPGLRVERW